MFNGIVYNQGIIKSFRRSPRYVKGSLVIEVSSKINFKNKILESQFVVTVFVLTLIRIKKNHFFLSFQRDAQKI